MFKMPTKIKVRWQNDSICNCSRLKQNYNALRGSLNKCCGPPERVTNENTQTRILDNRLYYTRKIELHWKGNRSRTVRITPILICPSRSEISELITVRRVHYGEMGKAPTTISFKLFFVWALLLIVHTWNSRPPRSNRPRLQCTCTVLTISGRPHESPLVWACQWPSSQPHSSPQLSHNDSLWA